MTVGVLFRAMPSTAKPHKAAPTNGHYKTQKNPADAAAVLLFYIQTLTRGNIPNKLAIISALRACSLISSPISEGRALHTQIVKTGFGSDKFVASSLIRCYSAGGLLSSARKLFDGIYEKDTALHTAMLVGYVENCDIGNARLLFDGMPVRDVVAWNAMLSGYTRCGLPDDALELFREMQFSEFRPNEVTLVSALSACSQLGCLALGEWIHAYIERDPDIRATPTLNNSLVHMYAKCGRLDAAVRVFLEKGPRNLESWNTMLTGFAIHGCGTSALSLLSQMIKMAVMPDRISFVGLLMVCSHAGGGMVEHARGCFDCMNRVYGVEPKHEHYGCMVDVLSRGGHLEEAHRLIKLMPFEPDAYVWGALLAGCCTHRNYELGLEAANFLIELEPWEEGRYIALLNLYAMSGQMQDAMKVRKAMFNMGVRKSSGSSMIEVDGVLHEFTAGDRSHYRSKDIYSMIENIGLNLIRSVACVCIT